MLGGKEIVKRFKKNVSLKEWSAFKTGGAAKYFYIADEKSDLIDTIKKAKEARLRFFVLGGGSNVLFSDAGYNGLVIKNKIADFHIKKKKEGRGGWFEAVCESGASLSDLALESLKRGLTGLEWAVGIPGTVGGAVYGNSGAFNHSISDAIKSVEVLNLNNLKLENFSKKECRFSYKDSIFKRRKDLLIVSATLKLKKGDKKKVIEKKNNALENRKKSQPLSFASAGCVFKNYQGKITDKNILKEFSEIKGFNNKRIIPAGYLIDKCGLKGKTIGGAMISKKHANFIVNLGRAKSEDIKKLISLIKRKVKNKFGISLEEEIKIVGCND